MAEYIDLQDAKKAWYRELGITSKRAAIAVDLVFERVPTADVVKVTRCKDCWAYETAEYYDGYKKRFCHLFKRQMQEDDFCSLGEPPNQFEKHSAAHMDGKEIEDAEIH